MMTTSKMRLALEDARCILSFWDGLRRARQASQQRRLRSGVGRSGLSRGSHQAGRWGAAVRQGGRPVPPAAAPPVAADEEAHPRVDEAEGRVGQQEELLARRAWGGRSARRLVSGAGRGQAAMLRAASCALRACERPEPLEPPHWAVSMG